MGKSGHTVNHPKNTIIVGPTSKTPREWLHTCNMEVARNLIGIGNSPERVAVGRACKY